MTAFFVENNIVVHLMRKKYGIQYTVHKNSVEVAKGVLYTQTWSRAEKLAVEILKNM